MIKMKTNLHRWHITHKGHCKWYYVDTNNKTIHIFAQKYDLNMETSLEFIFGYHKNHKGLIEEFRINKHKIIIYKGNDNNLYEEALVDANYYVDKGNNIHVEKQYSKNSPE